MKLVNDMLMKIAEGKVAAEAWEGCEKQFLYEPKVKTGKTQVWAAAGTCCVFHTGRNLVIKDSEREWKEWGMRGVWGIFIYAQPATPVRVHEAYEIYTDEPAAYSSNIFYFRKHSERKKNRGKKK